MQFRIPLGKKILDVSLLVRQPPSSLTAGISNRTEDNYFLPVFDYDDVEEGVVFDDIDFLQKNFNIGTVVVSTSGEEKMVSGKTIGHYHVIGFTKFTFPEIKNIIDMSRCDEKFKKGYRFQQRSWVLRILEKTGKDGSTLRPRVKFKKLIVQKHKPDIKSNKAMLNFIGKYYGLNLGRFFNLVLVDNTENVVIITYPAK